MDNIYIKLIPNEARESAKHPSWVAPINPKSPEGKEWRIGVKIGETWYNQAGFDELAEDGQPTGGLTIRLTPNEKRQAMSYSIDADNEKLNDFYILFDGLLTA